MLGYFFDRSSSDSTSLCRGVSMHGYCSRARNHALLMLRRLLVTAQLPLRMGERTPASEWSTRHRRLNCRRVIRASSISTSAARKQVFQREAHDKNSDAPGEVISCG